MLTLCWPRVRCFIYASHVVFAIKLKGKIWSFCITGEESDI